MGDSHGAALAFVGIDDLDGRPHVVVDGAPRPGSVLVLSHWPSSPTPPALRRDLSTESAFAYLDAPGSWAGTAVAVTSDHADEDGLAGLFALVNPPAALARRAALVEVARAGDFGVVADRRIGRTAFALATLLDPARSPLAAGLDDAARTGTAWTAHCYRELLVALGELVDAPERFSPWWEEEDRCFAASAAAVAGGSVGIEEYPELDLAVVRVPVSLTGLETRIGHSGLLPLHPGALHSATAMPRIAVVNGDRFCYYDRYESWVRLESRRLARRRDLALLAARLDEEERGPTRWRADPPGALVAVLAPLEGAASSLAPTRVLELLVAHLGTAPPAWDPHREAGALVPREVSGPGGSRSGTSGRGRPRR